MKKIYVPHNVIIQEKSIGRVEVTEDGEWGDGTDRQGMPYSRLVATFESVALARRSFPSAHIEESFAQAFAKHTQTAQQRIYNAVLPSDMDTEVEPDPVFDAIHEIRFDEQGVPH